MQDKNNFNENGEFHGCWEKYYPDGVILSKGYYINDKRYGYWFEHLKMSNLKDEVYYAR